MDENLKNALCKQVYLLSLASAPGATRPEKRHRARARLQMFLSDWKGTPLTTDDLKYCDRLDAELGEFDLPDVVTSFDTGTIINIPR